MTYQEKNRGYDVNAKSFGIVTAIAGVTSAGFTYFWHKLLKKRAKRHGEKSTLTFFAKDWLARYPRFILKEFLVRHR